MSSTSPDEALGARSRAGSTKSSPRPDESNELPKERAIPSIVPLGGSPNSLDKGSTIKAQNSEFQGVWESVWEGVGTTASSRKQAAVLMISWDDDLDDLNTAAEVDALSEVFEKKFNYQVMKKRLTAEKRPDHQLTKHLADFVCEFDNDSTLLIIYYAGHGTSGRPGELHFTSKNVARNKLSARNSLPWHDTEHSLQNAEGDVLLIFDCCYAGNLSYHFDKQRSFDWPMRSFEFLAACKNDSFTSPPGPNSFTSALIWALEHLVERYKKFTTLQLRDQIKLAPRLPPKQIVQIHERAEACDQRIILAPISSSSLGGKLDESLTATGAGTSLPKNFFDLRVWYQNDLDTQEVEKVARHLKALVLKDKIGANRIAWVRYNDDLSRIRPYADLWKRRTLRKLSAREPPLTLEIPQSFDPDHLHALLTPPASRSGNSSKSDSYIGKADPFGDRSATLHSDHGETAKEVERLTISSERTKLYLPRDSFFSIDLVTSLGGPWLRSGVFAVLVLSYLYFSYHYLLSHSA